MTPSIRNRSLIFVSILLLVTLISPAASRPLDRTLAQSDSEENCVATAFDIAGQGNVAIDGASGVIPDGATPDQILAPTDPNLQMSPAIGTTPVAILVIDDFFAYKDGLAHGRLVTDFLLAAIQGNATYGFEPEKIKNNPAVWAWRPSGKAPLYVVEVDTENYDSEQLVPRVSEAADMAVNELGARRLVYNMSFVLIPCSTADYDLKALKTERVPGVTVSRPILAEVAQAKDLPAASERAERAVVNESIVQSPATRDAANAVAAYAQNVARKDATAGTSGALDPLHDLIKRQTSNQQYWSPSGNVVVVAVGSAGNFGRDLDSFVPAAWPEVISASAFIGLKNAWASSNRGQAMLPGGLFEMNDMYLIGTSFSAPVMSMNMAFYLTNSSLCGQPPLVLDTARFRDSTVPRAVNPRCNPRFMP